MVRALLYQRFILLCSFTTLTLYQSWVSASGFGLIEHSASGIGNAFAGSAAIAEDSSTIYYNPAGMSELNGSQFIIAGHFISPKIDYSDEGSLSAQSNSLTGTKMAEAGVNAIVPNLYFSSMLNENLVYGLGVNVPFGLTTEYEDDWVGRYHAIKSEMLTININPSIALKLTDNVSIGFGMNIQKLDVSITSAVDFGNVCIAVLPSGTCTGMGLTPQLDDGFAKVSGDSWSTGLNFGTLIKITDMTRVGLSYRSAIKHSIEGDADFDVPTEALPLTASGLFTDSTAEAEVKLPASASLSLVHSLVPKTHLLFDITWTQWSNFEELKVNYLESPQPDSVTTSNWNDIYRFSMGINHQIKSNIKLRTGVAYDQSPIPDEVHRTPRIPDSDRVWLTAGIGIDLLKNVHVDIGYAHIFGVKEKTNNTFESSVPTINHSLVGEYEVSVDIFSAQLVWRI